MMLKSKCVKDFFMEAVIRDFEVRFYELLVRKNLCSCSEYSNSFKTRTFGTVSHCKHTKYVQHWWLSFVDL